MQLGMQVETEARMAVERTGWRVPESKDQMTPSYGWDEMVFNKKLNNKWLWIDLVGRWKVFNVRLAFFLLPSER
jgi:hypothetical protein